MKHTFAALFATILALSSSVAAAELTENPKECIDPNDFPADTDFFPEKFVPHESTDNIEVRLLILFFFCSLLLSLQVHNFVSTIPLFTRHFNHKVALTFDDVSDFYYLDTLCLSRTPDLVSQDLQDCYQQISRQVVSPLSMWHGTTCRRSIIWQTSLGPSHTSHRRCCHHPNSSNPSNRTTWQAS